MPDRTLNNILFDQKIASDDQFVIGVTRRYNGAKNSSRRCIYMEVICLNRLLGLGFHLLITSSTVCSDPHGQL